MPCLEDERIKKKCKTCKNKETDLCHITQDIEGKLKCVNYKGQQNNIEQAEKDTEIKLLRQAISTLISENKELKEENEYLKSQIPVDKIFYYSYKDFIPKSKVEMEIHDIDNWLEGGRYIHYGLNPYELEAQKKVLQSLLGKE